MRTHIPVGTSLPKDLKDSSFRMAASRGLKWSAFIQQLLIAEHKRENANLTTEEIMGTEPKGKKTKLTPAQRVAVAKLELAKSKKRPKKAK